MTEINQKDAAGTSVVPKPNCDAATLFNEALDAVIVEETTEHDCRKAIINSLYRTMCIIEHRRGEHKDEIATYLDGVAAYAPKRPLGCCT